MDKEKVVDLILGKQYYSINDLRYNQKLGIMLSKDEFDDFLAKKDELADNRFEYIKKLPLKTFNSRHCFYVNGVYLLNAENEYLRIFVSDLEINQSTLFDRNTNDILLSRLFSEVEGSLGIENVPTTHKRIVEIQKNDSPKDANDIIIKNMLSAIKYIINENPDFNKDNLLELYKILSNGCLADELRIKDGMYYRDDKVYIDGYNGAPPNLIDECMDTLFKFANDPKNIEMYGALLPYICHYYVLYVHPYFDYNGRTARMVSFWLNWINKIPYAPYFMSEAINESKNDYYNALRETRNTNNDLTCFLGYILETSIKYSFVYKNLEEMKKELMKTGNALTSTEWVYVKKILVHNPENYFNYKMFLEYIKSQMSRAGAIKILNNLTEYNILLKSENKRGGTIYKLNSEYITYKYNK